MSKYQIHHTFLFILSVTQDLNNWFIQIFLKNKTDDKIILCVIFQTRTFFFFLLFYFIIFKMPSSNFKHNDNPHLKNNGEIEKNSKIKIWILRITVFLFFTLVYSNTFYWTYCIQDIHLYTLYLTRIHRYIYKIKTLKIINFYILNREKKNTIAFPSNYNMPLVLAFFILV